MNIHFAQRIKERTKQNEKGSRVIPLIVEEASTMKGQDTLVALAGQALTQTSITQ